MSQFPVEKKYDLLKAYINNYLYEEVSSSERGPHAVGFIFSKANLKLTII